MFSCMFFGDLYFVKTRLDVLYVFLFVPELQDPSAIVVRLAQVDPRVVYY